MSMLSHTNTGPGIKSTWCVGKTLASNDSLSKIIPRRGMKYFIIEHHAQNAQKKWNYVQTNNRMEVDRFLDLVACVYDPHDIGNSVLHKKDAIEEDVPVECFAVCQRHMRKYVNCTEYRIKYKVVQLVVVTKVVVLREPWKPNCHDKPMQQDGQDRVSGMNGGNDADTQNPRNYNKNR